MQIYRLNDLQINKYTPSHRSDYATTYFLQDKNQVLKIFSQPYLNLCREYEINIFQKLMYSEQIKTEPGIVQVTGIVVDSSRNVIGYLTRQVLGKSLGEYSGNLLKRWQKKPEGPNNFKDLSHYAQLHHKLETIVKNLPDVVIPDLCTASNIIVTKSKTKEISPIIIDYDSFQVREITTFNMSTLLGCHTQYKDNPKYFKNRLFTKELDIKSLITLYLLETFNINLSQVESNQKPGEECISLDEIFKYINLNEPDIQHKIWKIFQKDQANEYLGEICFY